MHRVPDSRECLWLQATGYAQGTTQQQCPTWLTRSTATTDPYSSRRMETWRGTVEPWPRTQGPQQDTQRGAHHELEHALGLSLQEPPVSARKDLGSHSWQAICLQKGVALGPENQLHSTGKS